LSRGRERPRGPDGTPAKPRASPSVAQDGGARKGEARYTHPLMSDTTTTAAPLDKSGKTIRDMFAGVAPRYDLLNHLLSANLDVIWRRRSAAVLGLPPGAEVLDLCCGTGDQATALRRRGARVAAADFCVPMLAIARHKFAKTDAPRPAALAADALALPFPDRRFAGATVSFGLRNVADLDLALRQLARVLRPGGKLVVLDATIPSWQPLKGLYLFYFLRLLPTIGRLLSPRGSAYDYLTVSVLGFPQRQEFLDRMAAAGFRDLAWENLSGGTVCIYQGRIPG
jgi:demethylmenaquinone methyltransferase/2-methoxy-6-polyprenyl-1,4-benzoquinol methylase